MIIPLVEFQNFELSYSKQSVRQMLGEVFELVTQADYFHSDSRVSMILRRTKWRLRTIKYRLALVDMQFSMRSTALLHDILQAHPRLYEKVFRPYLVCGMSPRQRAYMVFSHYQLACNCLSYEQVYAIHLHQGLNLCTFIGGGGQYTVRLCYVDQFEKEGEWTLLLETHQGDRLYSVSFSLIRQNTKDMGTMIGCLQGPSLPTIEARNQIKHLTKALYGLRPKALMIILVQLLGSNLGVKNLYGVRNEGQIYRCILNKRERVKTDYDALWIELGGKFGQGRVAELPLRPRHRTAIEIKPQKRGQYAKRYAFIEDLEIQIRGQLGRPSGNQIL